VLQECFGGAPRGKSLQIYSLSGYILIYQLGVIPPTPEASLKSEYGVKEQKKTVETKMLVHSGVPEGYKGYDD
jgi:anti-sigma-K factor RskA